jgi:hypothetical protein
LIWFEGIVCVVVPWKGTSFCPGEALPPGLTQLNVAKACTFAVVTTS